MDGCKMDFIARVQNDFRSKFGIPRQSGLVESLEATVIFEPGYRNPEALRGIADYSHLWLIWHFSESEREGWSPTVRPPRLGGNVRMGVFATRSPFRPNPVGLSCVKLMAVEQDAECGPILRIAGADLLNNTPIFDIKPYIPYADCHPEASSGFAADGAPQTLDVSVPDALLAQLPARLVNPLMGVLAQDPRPGYHDDPERVYKLDFAGFCVDFSVCAGTVKVRDLRKL